MLRNDETVKEKTNQHLADIFDEMESRLIELSEALPTHPEPNRFAHGILELLKNINVYHLSEEARKREALKLKFEAPAQPATVRQRPNEIYQQENDSDDELETIGLEATMDPYAFVNFIKDYRLERLPRQRRGTPPAPLLQSESIARLHTLWRLIRTFANGEDPEHLYRIRRILGILPLYRADLFQKSELTRYFRIPRENFDDFLTGFNELTTPADSLFTRFFASRADAELVLARPDQAPALNKVLRWMTSHNLPIAIYREKLTRYTPLQLEILHSLDATFIFGDQNTVIAQRILDQIETLPTSDPEAKADEEKYDLEFSEFPTTIQVKTTELKLALSLYKRLRALDLARDPHYFNPTDQRLADLVTLSNLTEAETPNLTEGQLCRLIYITHMITTADDYTDTTDEHKSIATEAAELANHFFTPERAAFIADNFPGVPYERFLACFLVEPCHYKNIAPTFDHFNLGISYSYRKTDISHTLHMESIRCFLPWMVADDQERMKSVGRALRWIEAYRIATPERRDFIAKNPDGVRCLAFHWVNENFSAVTLQTLSAWLFDLLKPDMLEHQAIADKAHTETPAAAPPADTIEQFEAPYLIRLGSSPKGAPRARPARIEPVLHTKDALSEIIYEDKTEQAPAMAFVAKFNAIEVSDLLSHVEIEIKQKGQDIALTTLIDETYRSHQCLAVTADYLICTAVSDVAIEPEPYDAYDNSDDELEISRNSPHHSNVRPALSGDFDPEEPTSETDFLDHYERDIRTQGSILFWNLKTKTLAAALPCDTHYLRHRRVDEQQFIFTTQCIAYQYDLANHTYQTLYQMPEVDPYGVIDIVGLHGDRVLLKTKSELILAKQHDNENIQHYLAKAREIKILDAHSLLYTKAHQGRGGLGTARGTITLQPDTTVFWLQWDKEKGFSYEKKWRVSQEVQQMTVTEDHVLLFADQREVFALDLDDSKAKAVKLWTAGDYNAYQVKIALVSDDVLEVKWTESIYYSLAGLKAAIKGDVKNAPDRLAFFKEAGQPRASLATAPDDSVTTSPTLRTSN